MARATELTAALPRDRTLVVDPDNAALIKKLLGRSVDAVVLNGHHPLDANVVGQCAGLIVGGGALVVRLPRAGWASGFMGRLEAALARIATAPAPLMPPSALEVSGPPAQARVVAALTDSFARGERTVHCIVGPRGCGKSAAIGLALGGPGAFVVTSSDADGAAEVRRFAPGGWFVEPRQLLDHAANPPRCIVVDEAARMPIAWLKRVTQAFCDTPIVFATTTDGYEGTGRGFVLRFLDWLEQLDRPATVHHLDDPIRWAPGDPLSATLDQALCLRAGAAPASAVQHGPFVPVALTRERLRDERILSEAVGLLVEAHYRTSPRDVQLIVDDTNIDLHALMAGDHVAAVTMVAREGGLSPATCRRLAEGRGRIRGHALADSLICHSGAVEAGEWTLIRSVRIAVHPALRRRGLARQLIDHVHTSYRPDLFGTLFGVTGELLAFRRSVGYHLARVGVSRGIRTGEPAAMMLRPVTDRARRLLETLRGDLARELPLQLELMAEHGDLVMVPGLPEALSEGLPPALPLTAERAQAAIRSYLFGPRPSDTVLWALADLVSRRRAELDAADPQAVAVIDARVTRRQSWEAAAQAGGFANVRLAQRAMRRALRDRFGELR